MTTASDPTIKSGTIAGRYSGRGIRNSASLAPIQFNAIPTINMFHKLQAPKERRMNAAIDLAVRVSLSGWFENSSFIDFSSLRCGSGSIAAKLHLINDGTRPNLGHLIACDRPSYTLLLKLAARGLQNLAG
jgi:hypothetical protein